MINLMAPKLLNYLSAIIRWKTIIFQSFEFGWLHRPRLACGNVCKNVIRPFDQGSVQQNLHSLCSSSSFASNFHKVVRIVSRFGPRLEVGWMQTESFGNFDSFLCNDRKTDVHFSYYLKVSVTSFFIIPYRRNSEIQGKAWLSITT